jgi:hypothetical protein
VDIADAGSYYTSTTVEGAYRRSARAASAAVEAARQRAS